MTNTHITTMYPLLQIKHTINTKKPHHNHVSTCEMQFMMQSNARSRSINQIGVYMNTTSKMVE